jgi:hypothetical protein
MQQFDSATGYWKPEGNLVGIPKDELDANTNKLIDSLLDGMNLG